MSRRVLLRTLVVVVVVQLPGAVVTDGSSALTLTTPTVTTPTVPVKTPTVPVKTPTVTVKTPTVPVKTPTVPVKTPTVTVKTPAPPPVTVPSVPVKPPSVPAPPPAVPVRAPRKTTSIPVRTPVPLKPPAVTTPSIKAPALAPIPGTASLPAQGLAAPLSRRAPAATRSSRTTPPNTVWPAPSDGYGLAGGAAAAGALTGFGGLLEDAQALVSSRTAGRATLGSERALRLLARGRITLADPRLRRLVRSLEACLPLLPARLRAVLRLRTGVGGAHPFSARTVARRLHISRRRLVTLEVRSLRRLASAARRRGCSRAAAPAAGFASVSYLSFLGPAPPVPSGGVAGGLYLKTPDEPGPESVPPAEAIPSSPLRVRPAASNPIFWEAALAALIGVLLVVYLVRDDMGLGPLRPGRSRRRSHGAKPPDGDGER